MTERRIETPMPVLDARGIITPGYSTHSLCTYRRADIKAPFYRIKEWDFYQVSDQEKCLQFTCGHASYAGQVGIMLFNFRTGEMIADISKLLALPFGSLRLPEDAEADSDVRYDKGGVFLRFRTEGGARRLEFSAKGFEAEIEMKPQTPHSLVIHVPFDEYKTAFYYNQKINCMTASGQASYEGKTYAFGEEAYGLLDWGRGVWPFHNEWYWSNGTGKVDGELFGFNLGAGFGNTSAATENILFYRGETHKLGRVRFVLGGDYMEPWRIHDEEGRLDLLLTPTYDRTTRTDVLFIHNCCHQMFGGFSGKAVLEDGSELRLDGLQAFAEHAVNNW